MHTTSLSIFERYLASIGQITIIYLGSIWVFSPHVVPLAQTIANKWDNV